jgi:WD40 repeat protein
MHFTARQGPGRNFPLPRSQPLPRQNDPDRNRGRAALAGAVLLLLAAISWQAVRATRTERNVRAAAAHESSLSNEAAQARVAAATNPEFAGDTQAKAIRADDELAFEIYRSRITRAQDLIETGDIEQAEALLAAATDHAGHDTSFEWRYLMGLVDGTVARASTDRYLTDAKDWIQDLQFSPRGQVPVLTMCRPPRLVFLDLRTLEPTRSLALDAAGPTFFTPDGDSAIVYSSRRLPDKMVGTITAYDATTGETRWQTDIEGRTDYMGRVPPGSGLNGRLDRVGFGPDGRTFALWSDMDRRVFVWRVADGAAICAPDFGHYVANAAITERETLLVSTINGSLFEWDLGEKPRELRRKRLEEFDMLYGPDYLPPTLKRYRSRFLDGTRTLVAKGPNGPSAWSTQSWDRLPEPDAGRIERLLEHRSVTSEYGRPIHIRPDDPDGAGVILTGHLPYVSDVACSPDRSGVLAVSQERSFAPPVRMLTSWYVKQAWLSAYRGLSRVGDPWGATLEAGDPFTRSFFSYLRPPRIRFSLDDTRVTVVGSALASSVVTALDPVTGQELFVATIGGAPASVSPAGTLTAAIRHPYGKVEITDLLGRASARGTAPFEPPGGIGEETVISFAPDGRSVAVGSRYGQVRILQTDSGAADVVLPATSRRPREITALAFSGDGKLLGVGRGDGALLVLDPARKDTTLRVETRTRISALAFSHDARWIACGTRTNTVVVVEVGSGEEIARLADHRGTVTDLVFGPEDRYLLATAREIRLFDTRYFRPVLTWQQAESPFVSADFNHRGDMVAGLRSDGSIGLWYADPWRERLDQVRDREREREHLLEILSLDRWLDVDDGELHEAVQAATGDHDGATVEAHVVRLLQQRRSDRQSRQRQIWWAASSLAKQALAEHLTAERAEDSVARNREVSEQVCERALSVIREQGDREAGHRAFQLLARADAAPDQYLHAREIAAEVLRRERYGTPFVDINRMWTGVAEYRCGNTDEAIRHLAAAIHHSALRDAGVLGLGEVPLDPIRDGELIAGVRDLLNSLGGEDRADPRALFYMAAALKRRGEDELAGGFARLGESGQHELETALSPGENEAIRQARRECEGSGR